MKQPPAQDDQSNDDDKLGKTLEKCHRFAAPQVPFKLTY